MSHVDAMLNAASPKVAPVKSLIGSTNASASTSTSTTAPSSSNPKATKATKPRLITKAMIYGTGGLDGPCVRRFSSAVVLAAKVSWRRWWS